MSFRGGLYQGRLALEQLDDLVAEVAARMALGGRMMPTSRDVRDAAEEVVRATVNIIRQSLDVLDVTPSVPLGSTALAHLGGVQLTARRMIDGAIRERIPVADLRADLATLLRGGEVDASRYGLTRSDLTGLRTVKSDMERLVTDQLLDAAHVSEVLRLVAAGEVTADWVRSGTGSPCIECDALAAGSPYRLDEWPERPHPYCQCRPKKRTA
jgi:hypothetical protein